MVDKATTQIICTDLSNGKRHDVRVFKESDVKFKPTTEVLTDTGYQGLQKLDANSLLPKKKTKKQPLSKQEKKANNELASQRVVNENVIGRLKRFKIISDRYRNRRKRFGLRFNLIAGIYNLWKFSPIKNSE